ncbi:hypothetical protein D3C76_962130 [compost metagenome]
MIPPVATELIATPAAKTSEIIFFLFNFKTIPPQLQHNSSKVYRDNVIAAFVNDS